MFTGVARGTVVNPLVSLHWISPCGISKNSYNRAPLSLQGRMVVLVLISREGQNPHTTIKERRERKTGRKLADN